MKTLADILRPFADLHLIQSLGRSQVRIDVLESQIETQARTIIDLDARLAQVETTMVATASERDRAVVAQLEATTKLNDALRLLAYHQQPTEDPS